MSSRLARGAFEALRRGLIVVAALWMPAALGQSATAFVGATLIDGTGTAPVRDAVVVVDGERIVAAGRGAEVPADARVVDVSGKWIIPGLIDAHIHFFQSGGLFTRPDIIDLREVRPYAAEMKRIEAKLAQTLARYLASGITSVVDVGGPMSNFEVRDLARRTALAPRVAVAGPLLSTVARPRLATPDPAIIHITSAAAARAEVRRQLARRTDLIKVWFVIPRADPAPDLAWVRAAVEEAHASGVRVLAHATQARIARAVIEAGVDILAHSIDDEPVDQSLLERMRARGIVYITTLVVREGYREVFGQHVSLSDLERRLGDPEAIASFGELARLPDRLRPSWVRPSQPLPVDSDMAHNLLRMAEAGITVAAGSDAGNIGTLHGPALHRELELMVEAGLTPLQALGAASRGGAAVMGRSRELGTIEAGKLADMVILDADPLADIRNTSRIYLVVKGGRIHDPTVIERTVLAHTP